MPVKVLVTGGAGYIGSHTALSLLEAGHDVVILDNLSNSKEDVIGRLRDLSGRDPQFLRGDLLDRGAVAAALAGGVDAVVHFAALKAVGESVKIPLAYYENNVTGTINLLREMGSAGCRNIVFSSSATVYGDPASLPIREDFPLSATNPYGRTKLMVEEILGDVHASEPGWNTILLRYFNPVGAHASGRLGEDPNGIPNNLVPYIAKVAAGQLDELTVFGDDYPTRDGTGIRDYIHVVDLAEGHLRALEKLASSPGLVAYNLGTGSGTSVKEMVEAFGRACGHPIPHGIAPRRPGDVAACYADPSKAKAELGWEATRTVDDMCADTWRWQQWCAGLAG